jgi:hypothetical protein
MMLSTVVLAHLWFFMKANLVAGTNKALHHQKMPDPKNCCVV